MSAHGPVAGSEPRDVSPNRRAGLAVQQHRASGRKGWSSLPGAGQAADRLDGPPVTSSDAVVHCLHPSPPPPPRLFSASSQQLRGETQRAAGASSTGQAARRRPTLPPGVGEQLAHRRLGAINARLPEQRELQQAGGERALRGDCEEGSPPPHVRLHSSSAQQFGDTARLGAREQAHEGSPVREPPATDLEAEDKQAAAPAPDELRVSVVALAASDLAQG